MSHPVIPLLFISICLSFCFCVFILLWSVHPIKHILVFTYPQLFDNHSNYVGISLDTDQVQHFCLIITSDHLVPAFCRILGQLFVTLETFFLRRSQNLIRLNALNELVLRTFDAYLFGSKQGIGEKRLDCVIEQTG